MRKKILPIISTLILGLVPFGSASATTVIDGVEYWSVTEMVALDRVYEQEVREHCPRSNFESIDEYYYCIDNYRFERSIDPETGEWIYDSMNMLLESFQYSGDFFITSINPSTGQVRALYHDLNWPSGGTVFDEKLTLDHFHLFWSEEAPNFVKVYYTPRDFANGEGSELDHIIYFGDEATNGRNWFVVDREVELPVLEPIDIEKSRATYYFYSDAVNEAGQNHASIAGMIDFSSCLNSPRYEEGMECRYMFSSEEGTGFYPFPVDESQVYYKIPYTSMYADRVQNDAQVTDPVDDPTTDPADDPTGNDPVDDPTDPTSDDPIQDPATDPSITDSTENQTDDPTNDQADGQTSDTQSTLTPTVSVVDQPTLAKIELKAPETATPELDAATVKAIATRPIEHIVEFPWWFLALLAAGNAVILWWFLPSHKQNRRPNRTSKNA